MNFTSFTRNPALRMFASISGGAFSVSPSIRMWPLSDVTRIALRPQVPTYQVLPKICCGGAGSFHLGSAWQAAGEKGALTVGGAAAMAVAVSTKMTDNRRITQF